MALAPFLNRRVVTFFNAVWKRALVIQIRFIFQIDDLRRRKLWKQNVWNFCLSCFLKSRSHLSCAHKASIFAQGAEGFHCSGEIVHQGDVRPVVPGRGLGSRFEPIWQDPFFLKRFWTELRLSKQNLVQSTWRWSMCCRAPDITRSGTTSSSLSSIQ